MHYVYIIQSQKDKGYYIGSTSDLSRRLIEHKRGKTTSLRGRLPLSIILVEEYKTKHEALMRERRIKSYKGGEAFKKLIRCGTRVVNG